MSMDKIKLFETVLNIHSKGDASLTASERSLIESETRDLLSAASRKQAMMAPPEGFEALLMGLKSAENADDAFEMVVKFLEEADGLGKGPGKGPLGPDMSSPMADAAPLGLPEVPGPADIGLGLGKEDKGLDLEVEKDLAPPSLDKPEVKDDSEEKKDFPPKSKDKEDDKWDKSKDKKDLDSEKDKILAKVSELAKKAEDEDEEDEDEEKEEKEEKEDSEDKKEDSDDDKEDSKEDSDKEASRMKLRDPKTASKVKIRITASRNLMVSYDNKPLFHAIPNKETKTDPNALKRLANKVSGWVIYEGAKEAARKCGAKLFAGVDEGVDPTFDAALTPPASSGVSDEGETVVEEPAGDASGEVTQDAEFDTKETPEKVSAGVEDGGEVVTDEKPDSKPSEVLDGEEVDYQMGVDSPSSDVRDEAEVDHKMAALEESYRKLYAARADKKIKEANDKFVEKFVTCMKLASKRMLLNYDEHPYKAATLDVLTDAGIQFADGSEFTGLYEGDARELTEHIASAGHDQLVEQLFEKTAFLMERGDDYLSDMISDLENLSVKPVEVTAMKTANRVSDKSQELKKAASDGNFVLNTENVGTPVTSSLDNKKVGGVRAAIGDTLLGKRANVLRKFANCKSDCHDKE